MSKSIKKHDQSDTKDTPDVDGGSPITPLHTQPSGLTSAATTTTTTISSSSSSSSESVTGHARLPKKTDSGRSNLSAAQSSKTATASSSGEKPSKSKTSAASAAARSGSRISKTTAILNPKQARVSSASGPLKPPCKSSAPPPQQVKIAPTGNLFPSGKVQITGMTHVTPKSIVLGGAGAQSYGYGNIIRGSTFPPSNPTTSSPSSPSPPSSSSSRSLVIVSNGGSDADPPWTKVLSSSNPEHVNRIGNEMFKKGCYTESLKLYDRATDLSPNNATYRSNRAATLSRLDRIGEAVIDCEEAIKLDPNLARAHHRLATLFLRLGQIDNAGKHFFSVEKPLDPMVVKVLEKVDRHLNKCADARKRGEWNVVLTEVCSAMASGADWSPQLAMCKVEALLKLLRIDDAQAVLAFVPKVEPLPTSRFLDMISEAYTSFVKSQLELALGRFENAVTAAEKASEIDPWNREVETLFRNVRLIAKARSRGNSLYESERYTEASAAYTEGLKFDPSNAALFCYRADCFFKVGMWEKSIEDCDHALLILPSYKKPLLQRAASYSKLERWGEAVRDYETLRKELSYDKEIAESLFHAQVALKKSRGEVVLNMEFGGEVEEISSVEELRAALTRPGVSIVHFFRNSDQQCKELSVFVDALCIRYPSMHFLKVEIGKCHEVAEVEKVRFVPTFKIYKHGIRMKEIVCPSKEALENSVRQYYCL